MSERAPDAPRLETAAAAAAVIATAIGAAILTGWTLGLDVLKSLNGVITTKANMAVGLIACGLALGGILRKSPFTARAAGALALFAAALGGLTLSEHVFRWNLGIDQLLFREGPGAAATASPGRMGPNG